MLHQNINVKHILQQPKMAQFPALTCNYEAFVVSQLNKHEVIINDFYKLIVALIETNSDLVIVNDYYGLTTFNYFKR